MVCSNLPFGIFAPKVQFLRAVIGFCGPFDG